MFLLSIPRTASVIRACSIVYQTFTCLRITVCISFDFRLHIPVIRACSHVVFSFDFRVKNVRFYLHCQGWIYTYWRGVQNRPKDLIFTRPCNRIRLDPTSKINVKLCKKLMWTQDLIFHWFKIHNPKSTRWSEGTTLLK